jgi:hypothetical protein
MARMVSVDRDYQHLNEIGGGIPPEGGCETPQDKNRWNVVWESFAGVLFFGMDSSLECFAHAVNALGYLLRPTEFFDITSDAKLKQISPANLLDPPTKRNAGQSAYEPCVRLFPKICEYWAGNRKLLGEIIDYHDATKHRHSVVIGLSPFADHLLKPAPKEPMETISINEQTGLVQQSKEHTLQSITTWYHCFMVVLLRIARQELEAVFGQALPVPT